MIMVLIVVLCVSKCTVSTDSVLYTYTNRHPSAVMIIHNSQQADVRCTGNLLSSWWVLTAARCVFDRTGIRIDTKYIQVYAGYNNALEYLGVGNDKASAYAQKKDVDLIYTHPNYVCCKYDEDNVALIKVNSGFSLHSVVGTMALALHPLKTGCNHVCSVTGYGRDIKDTNNVGPRENPRHYRLCAIKERNITVNRRCSCLFKGKDKLQAKFVKVPVVCEHKNEGRETTRRYAFGDLGAGLVCKQKLFGVLSGILNSTFYQTCGRRSAESLVDVSCGEVTEPHTVVFTSTCLHLRWISAVSGVLSREDVRAGGCDKLSRRFSKYSKTRKNLMSLYARGGGGAEFVTSHLTLTVMLLTTLVSLQ